MATAKSSKAPSRYPELVASLKDVRRYFIYAGLFSAAVNLLMLVPVIYMLQVYDRVMSSGSLPTLASLTLLMVALTCAMGGFEWVRSMILISASNKIESNLRKRVSDASFRRALMSGGRAASSQAISDLASLRQFLTGNGCVRLLRCPLVSHLCGHHVFVSLLVWRRRYLRRHRDGCSGLY